MLDLLHRFVVKYGVCGSNGKPNVFYWTIISLEFIVGSIVDYYLPISVVYNFVRVLICVPVALCLLLLFYSKYCSRLSKNSLYYRLGVRTRFQISFVSIVSLVFLGISFSNVQQIYTVSNSVIFFLIFFLLLFAKHSKEEVRRRNAKMKDVRDKNLKSRLFGFSKK